MSIFFKTRDDAEDTNGQLTRHDIGMIGLTVGFIIIAAIGMIFLGWHERDLTGLVVFWLVVGYLGYASERADRTERRLSQIEHAVNEVRRELLGGERDDSTQHRLSQLERKVTAATDRIACLIACDQKLREIRDDLMAVQNRLSLLEIASTDVRCGLLRSLQADLDTSRLHEVNPSNLVAFFECLRTIALTVRVEILYKHDVSEWALRSAADEFSKYCRRAEE